MEKKRSENMREIREAAVAYFKYMPEDVKEKARLSFKQIDTNGDEKISYAEFSKAYMELDVSGDQLDNKLFKELDENGDGFLNFDEFLTLFYIYKSGRLIRCDDCKDFLKGLYFTCLPCFEQGQTMVNYCTACYQKGRHSNHQHNGDQITFIDNYALLLMKAGSTDGAAQPELSELLELSELGQLGKLGKRQKMKKFFLWIIGTEVAGQASGKATEAAEDITDSCSIM